MAIVIGSNSVITIKVQEGRGKDANKETIKVNGLSFEAVIETITGALEATAKEGE